MEPKRSKYDTNPLDEKVADEAEESWGPRPPASGTEGIRGGPTHDISRDPSETARTNPESQAPTRPNYHKIFTTYPSIIAPPQPKQSAAYQPPRAPSMNIYQPPPFPAHPASLPP